MSRRDQAHPTRHPRLEELEGMVRDGRIDTLVVAKGARRAGCGRKLLEAATRWARERKAEEILLTVWEGNKDAEHFYRKLGLSSLSRVMKLSL